MDSISDKVNCSVQFIEGAVNTSEYSSRITDICADFLLKVSGREVYSEKSLCIYEMAIAIQRFLRSLDDEQLEQEFSYRSIESEKPYVFKVCADGDDLVFINGLTGEQKKAILRFSEIAVFFVVLLDDLKRHFSESYGVAENVFLKDSA